MLEEKVREVFADMVVLKDPQRSQYFSNLSIPSYMRDWLVMKFRMMMAALTTIVFVDTSNGTFPIEMTSNNISSKW